MEIGKQYTFKHKRKGTFSAKFLGDHQDGEHAYYRVAIDTSAGSPYAHLANAVEYVNGRKTTPKVTEKLLLVSLVEAVNG